MKRRQAIKSIAILASAAAVWPGCQPDASAPAYERIPLDHRQRQLLEQFTEALLPKGRSGVQTPESTTDFTLTVLNDCHSPEDIQKFVAGLTELQAHLDQKYQADFGALGTGRQAEVFAYLSNKDGLSEPLRFFYDTARSLAIEHFTSSEAFLKNIMDWEFAPGRYLGCVPVAG